jgi:hypothetical protein
MFNTYKNITHIAIPNSIKIIGDGQNLFRNMSLL